MWLETAKMAPELTRNSLGGGLLGDLLRRMADAQEALDGGGLQAPYYKLLTLSSHYNTQLGVLSALAAGAPPESRPDHPWRHAIPALASVLAFELHRGADGAYAVRAVFQDGPSAAYQAMPLPCAARGDAAEALAGRGACSLDAFRALAGPQALNTSADWCEACANSQVSACQLGALQRQLAEAGLEPGSGGGRTAPRVSPGMVAVWCVVSVAAAAVLAVGAALLIGRRRRRPSKDAVLMGSAEGAVSPSPPLAADEPRGVLV